MYFKKSIFLILLISSSFLSIAKNNFKYTVQSYKNSLNQSTINCRSVLTDDEQKNLFITREINIDNNLCISLGSNCLIATHLENNCLRKMAFPFDWNLTSLNGLCDLINNDFIDFLNPKYFDRRSGIYNTKYNISFAHDFPVVLQEDGTHTEVSNYLDFLDEIITKYNRRIKRFYSACRLAETVYFFRLNSVWKWDQNAQDKDSITKLRDVLLKKFPTKNWILVAISTDPSYKLDWKIPMVKNFYVNDQGCPKEFYRVFSELGLVKPHGF